MEALRQFVESVPGCKIENTEKLFFSKFPYRVEFQSERYVQKTLPKSQAHRRRTIHTEIAQAIGFSGEFTARHRDAFCSLFFSNESDMRAAVEHLRGFVVSIALPRTQPDLDIMLQGDPTRLKTRIRPALFFFNRFRYAVTLKNSTTNDELTTIADWVRDFAENFPDEDRLTFEYSTPKVAYFNHEDDVLFFKLVFHSAISKLEKALLHQEIDNDAPQAAGATH